MSMTIDELRAALISMPPRTKFSHPYFSDDEYIYRDERGNLMSEEGYLIEDEFFALRRTSMPDKWYVKEN